MSESQKNSGKDYVLKKIAHFEKKANHNKKESILCFKLIMFCTLLAPLFVSFGEGVWFGKVLPSFLSILAAFSTAWIQLRKPQELWSIYRTAQRKLEKVLADYEFELDLFDQLDEVEKGKKLVTEASNIVLEVHNQWLKKVPNVENIKLPE